MLCGRRHAGMAAYYYRKGIGGRRTGCGGDVRKSLNSVENCFFATPTVDGKKHIELELAKQLVQKSAVRYDKEGDELKVG